MREKKNDSNALQLDKSSEGVTTSLLQAVAPVSG